MAILFQKVCESAIARHAPKKSRTFRTLVRMDFARTRATAHRTCACPNAPLQLIPCSLPVVHCKIYAFNVFAKIHKCNNTKA